MKIKTNNIPRQLLSWSQLTPKEQSEFHYVKNPDEADFFDYRGNIYNLGEAVLVPDHLKHAWDGIYNDSAFSGVMVKMCDDPDYVVVGRFSC